MCKSNKILAKGYMTEASSNIVKLDTFMITPYALPNIKNIAKNQGEQLNGPLLNKNEYLLLWSSKYEKTIFKHSFWFSFHFQSWNYVSRYFLLISNIY